MSFYVLWTVEILRKTLSGQIRYVEKYITLHTFKIYQATNFVDSN